MSRLGMSLSTAMWQSDKWHKGSCVLTRSLPYYICWEGRSKDGSQPPRQLEAGTCGWGKNNHRALLTFNQDTLQWNSSRFILLRALTSPRVHHSGVRWLICIRSIIQIILLREWQNILVWVRLMLAAIIMVFITIMQDTLDVDILKYERVLVWHFDNWHQRHLEDPRVPLY